MAQQVRGKAAPYLRAWRLHRNMQQGELAEAAGVTRATASRAEQGDQIVSFVNLRKFAKVLDISVDDLLNKDPEGGA